MKLRVAVVDVSDPTAPVETGWVTCPGIADHIVVSGNTAYVGFTPRNGTGAGLQIVDITDPSAPATLGFLGMGYAESGGLALAGDRAYLAAGRGLQVIDVANPGNPDGWRVVTPFMGETTVVFELPAASSAHLAVFDVTGRRVADLASGAYGPGSHRVVWDGRGADGRPVASGVYWVRLQAGEETRVRRALRLR